MKLNSLFAFMLVIALAAGCSQSPYSGMSEGKIVYDLQITSEDINPMMKAMMPSEATTYFCDGKSCTVMSGPAGIFESRILTDPSSGLRATLFSAMGQKMAIKTNPDSLQKQLDSKMGLDIEFTGNKKEIAGISCKEAKVTDRSGHVFQVYFTDDLDIDQPNWGTPFREIGGMMMEYSFEMSGMKLHMKAKKVAADKPDSSLFVIPSDYEIRDGFKDNKSI